MGDRSNDKPVQDVAEDQQGEIEQAAFVRGKSFVVVEDDTLVAEALGKTLARLGGKVKLFSRAEVALNHASINKADYFIADFMLGGTLNGIQFLDRVCQKRGKPIKAVIMTGDTSPNFVREAANCSWPVLHKPASLSRLISSLKMQA